MEAQANEPTDSTTAQIKALLSGEIDTIGVEADSESLGPGDTEEVLRGDDSGAGAVDLGDDDAPEGVEATESHAEDDDNEGQGEPVDLEFLSEQLGVEKSDLYELEIPLGDGEKTTLGALKDNFKEYGPVEQQRAQLAKQKDKYERDVLATRQHLNAMQPQTPQEQQVWDAMMARGSQNAQVYERQQHELLMETVPEWQDTDTRAKDRDAIVRLGGEYGFSQAEMAYTHDARTLRMLRDMVRDRTRLQEIDSQPERSVPKPNATGKRPSGKLTKRRLQQQLNAAKQATHLHDKAPAIKQLLNR